MGWTTEVTWTDLSTMYNAPPGLLLSDLLAAAEERWNVFNDTPLDKSDVGENAPLNIIAYRNIFVSVVNGYDPINKSQIRRFVRPVNGVGYDWTNEPDMLYWDMTSMVTHLGVEPGYGYNAPLTAEWCQWWYNALNNLVQMEYGPVYLMSAASVFTSRKSFIGAAADFDDAKAQWVAALWSTPSVMFSSTISQQVLKTAAGNWLIRRYRSITDQATTQWKPHLYTGNYTVNAWSRFGPYGIYDNVDFPCAEDTFAMIWDDASTQSGVYGNDIAWGYFDDITTDEPEAGTTRGWSTNVNTATHQCRFGFDFIPAPPP